MSGYSYNEDRVDELAKFFVKKSSKNTIRTILIIAGMSLLSAVIVCILFAVRMLQLGSRNGSFYAIQRLYWRATLGHTLTTVLLLGVGACAILVAWFALTHFAVFLGYKVLCEPSDVVSLLEHRSLKIDRNVRNYWRIFIGFFAVAIMFLAVRLWKTDSVPVIVGQFKFLILIFSLLVVAYSFYDLACAVRYSGLPPKRILDIRWGRAASVENAIQASIFIVVLSLLLPSAIQWLGRREARQSLRMKEKIVRFDCSGPTSADCEAIKSEAIQKIEDNISFLGRLLGTGARRGGSVPTATVTATKLNLRSRPSEDAPVLGGLDRGTTVDIIARDSGWIQVNSQSGKGWISSQYVQINEAQPGDSKKAPSLANAVGQVGFVLGFALSVLYIGLPMLYRMVPLSLLLGFVVAVVSTIAGNVAAWLLAKYAGISNPYHWVSLLALSVVSMAAGSIFLPDKKSRAPE